MRITLAVLTLCLFVQQLAVGQTASNAITNSVVIGMTKAGIDEATIIGAIQHRPDKFDTSPQALTELKAAGVSDQVLNAMLASANAQALFQKALDAIGPHETLMAVHSVRVKANITVSGQGRTLSLVQEHVSVFPDEVYTASQPSTGPLQKQVITPDFNYVSTGTFVSAVPPAYLETARQENEFGTMHIAQRAADYTITSAGTEQRGNVTVEKLKISKQGEYILWDIDPQTGRILSSSQETAKGNVAVEFSDYRLVQGIYVPFKSVITEFGDTVEVAITEYELNPVVDPTLFQRPTQALSQSQPVSAQSANVEPNIVKCENDQTLSPAWSSNCAHVWFSGALVKVMRSNGVLVFATLRDTGKYLVAQVGVINKTASPLDVLPQSFSMNVLKPHPKKLSYLPPDKVIRSIGNSAAWSNFFTALGAAGVTQQSVTQSTTNGTASAYGSGGSAYGRYSENTTSVTTVPDEQAQQDAANRIAANNANVAAASQEVSNGSLQPTTVAPGKSVAGNVYFERARKIESSEVLVPVNGEVFDFVF